MNNFHRFQNFRQFSTLLSQIWLKKRQSFKNLPKFQPNFQNGSGPIHLHFEIWVSSLHDFIKFFRDLRRCVWTVQIKLTEEVCMHSTTHSSGSISPISLAQVAQPSLKWWRQVIFDLLLVLSSSFSLCLCFSCSSGFLLKSLLLLFFTPSKQR